VNPVGAFQFEVSLVDPPPTGLRAPTDGLSPTAVASAGGSAVVRFAECHGLDAGLEVETYREGGRNANPLRFPRWGQFANLVLRRGVTTDTALWDWYFQVQFGTAAPQRRSGFVVLRSNAGAPVAGWFFSNALPERLVGPTLSARSSEIAVESLEIAHEGLIRLGAPLLAGFAAAGGGR
jgi:phage tail-like protein